MNTLRANLCSLACCLAALTGCDASAPAPPMTAAGPRLGDLIAERAAATRQAETAATQPTARQPAAAAEPAPYKPPFPERDDPFFPPNPDAALKAAKRNAGSDVVLLGIIDVDGRRALLDLNGVVVQVREREHSHGVQVVAIEPPRVTLEKGERRWTVSLYDPR